MQAIHRQLDLHLGNSRSRAGHTRLHCGCFRKPRCLRCHAALDDPGSSPGDPAVQDNVVKMVRLQIGQEKVKESVEEEKAKLQALADEAKEEVDKLQQLMKDRSSLAFGSALADVNQSADELEEMLRQSRAKMEAHARDLADWEVQTARARNEGTFFKGLFKADVLQQAPMGGQQEHAQGAAPSPSSQIEDNREMEPYTDKNAALRASSDVLKYSFSFLAFVLFSTVLGDVAAGSASLSLDGRNALLGLLLAYGAWKASQYS